MSDKSMLLAVIINVRFITRRILTVIRVDVAVQSNHVRVFTNLLVKTRLISERIDTRVERHAVSSPDEIP